MNVILANNAVLPKTTPRFPYSSYGFIHNAPVRCHFLFKIHKTLYLLNIRDLADNMIISVNDLNIILIFPIFIFKPKFMIIFSNFFNLSSNSCGLLLKIMSQTLNLKLLKCSSFNLTLFLNPASCFLDNTKTLLRNSASLLSPRRSSIFAFPLSKRMLSLSFESDL